MMERKRRVFPEGFKREAMERVRSSGVPIVRVAHENGGAKDALMGPTPSRHGCGLS